MEQSARSAELQDGDTLQETSCSSGNCCSLWSGDTCTLSAPAAPVFLDISVRFISFTEALKLRFVCENRKILLEMLPHAQKAPSAEDSSSCSSSQHHDGAQSSRTPQWPHGLQEVMKWHQSVSRVSLKVKCENPEGSLDSGKVDVLIWVSSASLISVLSTTWCSVSVSSHDDRTRLHHRFQMKSHKQHEFGEILTI